MKRNTWLFAAIVSLMMLTLSLGPLHAQNYIPLWDSMATLVGDSVIYQDMNGNIGIGTPTPLTRLDVNGNASFTGVDLGSFGVEISRAGELNVDSGCDTCPPILGGRFKVAQN